MTFDKTSIEKFMRLKKMMFLEKECHFELVLEFVKKDAKTSPA